MGVYGIQHLLFVGMVTFVGIKIVIVNVQQELAKRVVNVVRVPTMSAAMMEIVLRHVLQAQSVAIKFAQALAAATLTIVFYVKEVLVAVMVIV